MSTARARATFLPTVLSNFLPSHAIPRCTSLLAAVCMAFSIAILCMLPTTAQAQDLNLSVQAPTGDNNTATYALDGGEVSFIDGTVRFQATGTEITGVHAWGVSPGLSVVALAKEGSPGSPARALIMSATGDTLASYPLGSIQAQDQSLGLFPGDDGSLWVRSNISTFTGYDIFGRSSLSLTGGNQGSGGATMPQVVTDPSGRTLMLYTEQIKTGGGNLGSGAQRLGAPAIAPASTQANTPPGTQSNSQDNAQREFESIYYSQDRSIAYADVSEDGQFMVLVTKSEGTDDRVHILDRYGNTIATVSSEEELTGANLSGSAEYLVAWSEGRAIVYNTLTGERVRSASFRIRLYHAQYFPEDETILGLTGDYSERTAILNSSGFYAIDLGAGQIASAQLGTNLGFSGSFRPKFQRTGPGEYLLLGASRRVEIQTSF